MKKLTLIIYPFIIGLLSGSFIECCLCFLAIMMSPFSGYEENGVLIFCGIFAFLLVLLIIVAIVLNVKCLVNLNSPKVKLIIIAQVCAMILIFFASWAISEWIFDVLYDRFIIY